MSPIDAAIVRRKRQHTATCLEHLRPMAGLTAAEYAGPQRFMERKATERLLQEAIEAALDVNARLIAELGGGFPADYHGGFLALGRLGLVSNGLALELTPSAGLRNRLVHGYEGPDDRKVFASIESLLRLCPRFVSAVETYIERPGL